MNEQDTPAPRQVVIPCDLSEVTRNRIKAYAEALRDVAPSVGDHGLSRTDFEESGLFGAAIERLRGQRAATMHVKQQFLREVLDHLKSLDLINGWSFTGAGERHDYQVSLIDGRTCVFEAKGCLDGNNTTIFQRPPNADEFVLWSLCQNPGSNPKHNAWSGIHTRLGAKIVAENVLVDGLVIWDMLCGTLGRPCPKLADHNREGTLLESGRIVPPPCLYLFPRTVPDPRNNPRPPVRRIEEVGLLAALHKAFGGLEVDIIEVSIETRMHGSELQRRTALAREGTLLSTSQWATIRRAAR